MISYCGFLYAQKIPPESSVIICWNSKTPYSDGNVNLLPLMMPCDVFLSEDKSILDETTRTELSVYRSWYCPPAPVAQRINSFRCRGQDSIRSLRLYRSILATARPDHAEAVVGFSGSSLRWILPDGNIQRDRDSSVRYPALSLQNKIANLAQTSDSLVHSHMVYLHNMS